jgi:hypothetical protein
MLRLAAERKRRVLGERPVSTRIVSLVATEETNAVTEESMSGLTATECLQLVEAFRKYEEADSKYRVAESAFVKSSEDHTTVTFYISPTHYQLSIPHTLILQRLKEESDTARRIVEKLGGIVS